MDLPLATAALRQELGVHLKLGRNAAECAWVAERDWAYTCRFPTPEEAGSHAFLRFFGLDTVAEAWLNGVPIGSFDNMFREYVCVVGDRLHRDGEQNDLLLVFRAPLRALPRGIVRHKYLRKSFNDFSSYLGARLGPSGRAAESEARSLCFPGRRQRGECAMSETQDGLRHECLRAEELIGTTGWANARDVLADIARRHPRRPEPHVSLAKLYRHAGAAGPQDVGLAPSDYLIALYHAAEAASLESPPQLETVSLLRWLLHRLALHDMGAILLRQMGRRHPVASVKHRLLIWAAVSAECRGNELAARQLEADAACFLRAAVELHREALSAWPDAPVDQVLESYFGESHVMSAYRQGNLAAEWLESVVGLLDSVRVRDLPAHARARFIGMAADMACEAGRHADAIDLARQGLLEGSHGDADDHHVPLALSLWGNLLRGCASLGDSAGVAESCRRIGSIISELRAREAGLDAAQCGPSLLADACNIAMRALVVSGLWEPALNVASEYADVWQHGATWYMAAVAAWAGRRDRSLALHYLGLAAQDRQMSGRGECRNLLDDFLHEPAFAALRDAPDFLAVLRGE
ncbi:MAG: glycosyl hydrolase 2 galactose-binding domain-containing protein [Planctomycetota bacterium]|jgi:hypothetical protein